MILENNKVVVEGEIASGFSYNHESFGEKFYMVDVKCQRLSGYYDTIPVMLSERLIDVSEEYIGYPVRVSGQFRSYNNRDEEKTHLVLSVFAREFTLLDVFADRTNINQITLDGYICKKPNYRTTRLKRNISDVIMAVNRQHSKSDYIPCIAWGRNARYASQLEVGTRIQLEGRIQSREYVKKLDDGTQETRTAYEVSVSRIDVVEKNEENE